MTKKKTVYYVWDELTLHIQYYPLGTALAERCLGVPVFIVGLDGEFSFKWDGESDWRQMRAVLVPAGCVHSLIVSDMRIAMLYFEMRPENYKSVQAMMIGAGRQQSLDIRFQTKVIDMLSAIEREAWSANEAKRQIKRALYFLSRSYREKASMDARVCKIIEVIRSQPADRHSLKGLAEKVNLSPSRLVHLFKQETGVPLRRFRTAMRIKRIVTHVAAGKTLGDASVDNGFVDLAHFSNAYNKMFGISPSLVLSRNDKVNQFFVESQ